MTREETGDAMRTAVRNHCYRTQAPAGHYEACLADLRKEPAESWPWWISFFKGELHEAAA